MQAGIRRDDRPAITNGTEIFRRIKAERSHISKRAHHLTVQLGSVSLRTILDDS